MTETSDREPRRFNAAVYADGEQFGRIQDAPMGNIVGFLRAHESDDIASAKQPTSYTIEVIDDE